MLACDYRTPTPLHRERPMKRKILITAILAAGLAIAELASSLAAHAATIGTYFHG